MSSTIYVQGTVLSTKEITMKRKSLSVLMELIFYCRSLQTRGQEAKSSPQPVSVNKVLQEHSYSHLFCILSLVAFE